MERVTRIYKYALRPTGTQAKQLEACGNLTRFLWNRLVKVQKFAQNEIRNGRRATIEAEYLNFLAGKELVGMRMNAVKKLMAERSLNQADALACLIKEKSSKDIQIPVKKGVRLLKYAAKHLSWKYAVEKVNSERHKLLRPDLLSIWTGIQAKWINFGESWDKGIFMAPKFKKFGQFSTIQKQITPSSTWSFGKFINLSWCGSPCLQQVEVIVHRELPSSATIKQVALVRNSVNQWFVCVFIEAEKAVFEKKFTATGNSVGIDPGMKTALTLSTGEKIQPNSLSRQTKQARKLHRLQRKLARQTRINNPEVFNKDGTWKKGKRLTVRTKGMCYTSLGIADIGRYFKDAKADYYHNAAIKLLNQFDNIGVGNAKIHTLVRGEGKAKRAQNTRAREHSISDFIGKLEDKASLSLTPKAVYSINEAKTSKTCHVCGTETTLTLSIRKWKCNHCGTDHDRDVNGAINIRNRMISDLTAGAQPVSDRKKSKVHSSTKVPKEETLTK